MIRRGFTLIELMVSIGIFLISSTAMLTMLFGATELFRRGEAARQSGDEATMVLASLRDDLSRLVPVRMRRGSPASEWGWLSSSVTDAAGNCDLWLTVVNPDVAEVSASGSATGLAATGTRMLVHWYVKRGSEPSDDQLIRETFPWSPGMPPAHGGPSLNPPVITRGCLHFGVWFEMPELHRPVTAPVNGTSSITWEGQPPKAGGPYDSAQPPIGWGSGFDYWPMADAVRVSLVLTGGGRFGIRGTLAQAITGDSVRVSGIKGLPTIAGKMVRIGNEWVGYDDFRGNQLTGLVRQRLRSEADPATIRTAVWAGQPFSLVVELPR